MSRTHAILSPSASHRWLHCTAAPSLEKDAPEEASVYAEEGTLAHAICEAKLHTLIGDGSAEDYYEQTEGGRWTEHPLYKPEMEETSDYYRDVVGSKFAKMREHTPDAVLLIEAKLDFARWIPEGFGTADAIIIGDGEIDVIDYKHGMGVKVDAEYNPQMMTYAIGACDGFGFEYALNKVTMTIVQPRIDNTSTWEIPYTSLVKWAEQVLKPKALEAYNGTLGCETTTAVGAWCKFCKVKQICRARANSATSLLGYENPKLLSDKEVAELLPLTEAVESWCDDIKSYALGALLNGKKIEGYKVVEGKSQRKICDPHKLAENMVHQGIAEELLYKPKELRPLGELEKLVGKTSFIDISEGCINKPKGKPTLALTSDKRREYSTIDDDFSHILI